MVKDKEILVLKWKEQVFDRAEEVDPNNEMDWEDLAIGFFLGLGQSVEQAEELLSAVIEWNLI